MDILTREGRANKSEIGVVGTSIDCDCDQDFLSEATKVGIIVGGTPVSPGVVIDVLWKQDCECLTKRKWKLINITSQDINKTTIRIKTSINFAIQSYNQEKYNRLIYTKVYVH